METENNYISKAKLSDALELSRDLLTDIELSRRPLNTIALSASRLARLLNDEKFQKIFEFESVGYPTTPKGFSAEIWAYLKQADRVYSHPDEKDESKMVERAYGNSIEEIEQHLATRRLALEGAKDPNISITSANPNQYVMSPSGNRGERHSLIRQIGDLANRFSQRRHFLYKYALSKHMELAYTNVVDSILNRNNFTIAERLQNLAPNEVQKLTAIYDNLLSDNHENWANAVHSCRRLLQSVADALHPPGEDISKNVNGKVQSIKMGKENYINRLIAFVESKAASETYNSVVGSNISYMGERLDALFGSAQKGSHASVDKKEAERYVIYTFLLLGDILTL